MGDVTVPQCGTDHKILKCDKNLQLIFHHLLQFPMVRLKEVNIYSSQQLHLLALHPDLQVNKLMLHLDTTVQDCNTVMT